MDPIALLYHTFLLYYTFIKILFEKLEAGIHLRYDDDVLKWGKKKWVEFRTEVKGCVSKEVEELTPLGERLISC